MRRIHAGALGMAGGLVMACWTAQPVNAQTGAVTMAISTGARAASKSIGGFVTPSDAGVRRVVCEVREDAKPMAPLIDRVSTATIDRDTGRFAVELAAALKSGNVVTTLALDNLGGTLATASRTVPTPPAVPPKTVAIPALTAPIREGTRQISGTVHPAEGIKKVAVMVFGQKTAQADGAPLVSAPGSGAPSAAILTAIKEEDAAEKDARRTDIASTAQIDANGLFTIGLNHPLIAGQQVDVIAYAADDESPARSYTVDTFGDWGRVRAYFAGGVIFSKENGEFSQQDLALTFAMDKTWLQSADSWIAGRWRDGAKVRPRQFHSFFDARLTALPVLAPASTPAAAATTGSARATTTAAAASTPSTVDQFVTSRKAAMLQVGVYVPFYGKATTWTHAGAPNTLFFAPLVKAGVVTINGDAQSAEAVDLGGDDVFSFYAFGFGIGHYRLSGSKDRASELISYLHVTAGRYENFEIHPDKNDPGIRERPLRLAIEGRLKIPETALQVGIDGNFGRGKDDLRFVFGTRFDIGELIGKLKSLSPTEH